MHLFVIYKVYADIRRGCIGGGGVKYNKCKRIAVFQRGEFIRGQRHASLRAAIVTKLFAALGLRDTEDCHDISLYQILL